MLKINILQNGGVKTQSRIIWIDLLKGLTIIGVIFVHAIGHPSWWHPSHVNAPFFFMAGMFFKPKPFGEFIKKNTYALLIPFIIFFLLSYPVKVVSDLWDYHSLSAVNWGMIGDVFKIQGRSDYLYVNVPLWFILCLFWVQIFYWLISRLPLWANVLVLAGIWLFSDFISAIPTPFMINNAVVWTLFFGVGNLSGKFIVEIVKNRSTTLAIIFVGSIVMIAVNYLLDRAPVTDTMFYMVWCIVVLASASLLDGKSGVWVDWLGFLGANTLDILGFHIWV